MNFQSSEKNRVGLTAGKHGSNLRLSKALIWPSSWMGKYTHTKMPKLRNLILPFHSRNTVFNMVLQIHQWMRRKKTIQEITLTRHWWTRNINLLSPRKSQREISYSSLLPSLTERISNRKSPNLTTLQMETGSLKKKTPMNCNMWTSVFQLRGRHVIFVPWINLLGKI